jgi:hypothetical protein
MLSLYISSTVLTASSRFSLSWLAKQGFRFSAPTVKVRFLASFLSFLSRLTRPLVVTARPPHLRRSHYRRDHRPYDCCAHLQHCR